MKINNLKNASVNIPYNTFNEMLEELESLREFLRETFLYCDTPEYIRTKASELNLLYEYWPL